METFSALLALCAGNSQVTGEFPTQRPQTGALMFSLICVWINGWVNNREAGDLRRHRAHYDIIVMWGTSRFADDLRSHYAQGTSLKLAATGIWTGTLANLHFQDLNDPDDQFFFHFWKMSMWNIGWIPCTRQLSITKPFLKLDITQKPDINLCNVLSSHIDCTCDRFLGELAPVLNYRPHVYGRMWSREWPGGLVFQ